MAATLADPVFRAGLKAHLAAFATRSQRRATWELASTLVAYLGLLVAARESLALARAGSLGWGLGSAALVMALALVQVRAFLVHHDLCHFAAFDSRRLNLVVARLFGTLVSTSTHVWKREHDRHHRDSNNLDRAQDGQTGAWTVEQFRRAPRWQQRAYRFANHPVVLLGVLPPLYFLGFMRLAARWFENVLFALFLVLLWRSGTLLPFALALGPATAFGFLVFHAQHTGPSLVRRHTAEWDPIENGLRGSTCLMLPEVPVFSGLLRWCLLGVEFHHVHHLHPAMPAWRQQACHRAGAAFFAEVPRLSLLEALRATRSSLYDEAAGHLVGFAGR